MSVGAYIMHIFWSNLVRKVISLFPELRRFLPSLDIDFDHIDRLNRQGLGQNIVSKPNF